MGDKRAEGHALLMKMLKKKKHGSQNTTADSDTTSADNSFNSSTASIAQSGQPAAPSADADFLVMDLQKKLTIHARVGDAAETMAKVS